MKHEFEDSTIIKAHTQAVKNLSYVPDRITTTYLRGLLDALPEPQDDWEACTIEQIRRGDKVRWQDPVREDTCIHEIIALQTTPEDPGWLLYSRTETYYFPPDAVVDRIPAPVQHPDPEQHPVIANVAVAKPGTGVTHRYDYATWDAEFRYECWNHDGSYYGSWEPNTITEWEPAKVVPKVVETND